MNKDRAVNSATSEMVTAHRPITVDGIRGRTTVPVTEAAKIIGIGRNSCYAAIARGEIPSLKFGTRIVVPVAPLLRLLGLENG